MKTLLWFPATEKSWVVSRDTRAPFCYNVTKSASKIGPKLACAAGGIVSVRD